MNWLKIAAELFRHTIASGGLSARPPERQLPPAAAETQDVVGLLNSYRAEVERNLQTLAQILADQNNRLLRALEIQRRWNYGLTAAIVIVAILAIALYVRG